MVGSTWTDADIPAHDLIWLRSDLKGTDKSVIVFAHQRLDEAGPHAVKNAADMRDALESSGTVLAVFQAHSQNDHQEIGGIQYATLVAMVEGAGPDTRALFCARRGGYNRPLFAGSRRP